MVELVTFLTGSVFLYFALKMLLMKVFYDTIKAVVLHKYSLIIIFSVILGMIFMPDVVYPYVEITLKYFINGLKGVFTFVWDIVEHMFNSII